MAPLTTWVSFSFECRWAFPWRFRQSLLHLISFCFKVLFFLPCDEHIHLHSCPSVNFTHDSYEEVHEMHWWCFQGYTLSFSRNISKLLFLFTYFQYRACYKVASQSKTHKLNQSTKKYFMNARTHTHTHIWHAYKPLPFKTLKLEKICAESKKKICSW